LQSSAITANPQSKALSSDVDVERKDPINRSLGNKRLWPFVAQLNGGSLNVSLTEMEAAVERTL
jgi:hypothetical protein